MRNLAEEAHARQIPVGDESAEPRLLATSPCDPEGGVRIPALNAAKRLEHRLDVVNLLEVPRHEQSGSNGSSAAIRKERGIQNVRHDRNGNIEALPDRRSEKLRWSRDHSGGPEAFRREPAIPAEEAARFPASIIDHDSPAPRPSDQDGRVDDNKEVQPRCGKYVDDVGLAYLRPELEPYERRANRRAHNRHTLGEAQGERKREIRRQQGYVHAVTTQQGLELLRLKRHAAVRRGDRSDDQHSHWGART